MNRSIAQEPDREIALARESAFRLADTEVRPSALELTFQGETLALEPRVMQVLVALYRRNGQPVSRQNLVEWCWAGRVVTEGALNRAVAQLRKVIRDPGIRIDTVPTIGYRLHAVSQLRVLLPETSQAPDPKRTNARRLKLTLILAGLLVAIAAGTFGWLNVTRPVAWTATDFRPLTYSSDQETYPALSADGRQIIYAARPDGFSPHDLFLRNVNDGTTVQLTDTPADEYAPAWSPDGDRIAFARLTAAGSCQLVVMPIPVGAERVVAQCAGVHDTRPSWLNANTLLFGDRPGNSGVTRIRSVDINSGVARYLTLPPGATLGDWDPQAAPDGRHICFRRTLMFGADDLIVLDSATGQEHVLTTDGWKAMGYVWSQDSRYVFFASNRGGDFGLWSVDRKARAAPRRVSLGLGTVSFTRMSADRQNRLAVELVQGRNKLARLAPSGQIDVLTAGTGYEGEPAAGPDGTIAHVSNRGGFYELWLLPPGAEPVRLTSIQGSYIVSPAWSHDGTRIAFVAVKGRQADIFSVSRDGSQLRQLTHDGVAKKDVVFSGSSNRLFYLARANGTWQLMQTGDTEAATARPQSSSGDQGWVTLRSAPDGSVFGQRQGDETVRRVEEGAPVGNTLRVGDLDTWAVGSQGIYVRRGGRMRAPSVWFFPWDQAGRPIADVPLASGNISVDPQGAVIFAQTTNVNVDLAMIELHAQE